MAGFHQQVEELAGGKVIIKAVDDDGVLLEEQHGYPDVAIVLHYQGGNVVSENYIVNGEPASQKKYEQARLSFPDLPEAGQAEDMQDEIKAAHKAEHARWLEQFRAHSPDPIMAQDEDAHIRELISHEDTRELDAEANPGLVIYFDQPPGRKVFSLREKLDKYSIGKAWLIGVEEDLFDDTTKIGCDGIAVELPADAAQRSAFFIMADKAVKVDGFSAPMDNGQAFTFLTRI
jgi:hypothetical protein